MMAIGRTFLISCCSLFQQQFVRMLRKHRSLGHQKEMLRNLDILAYQQYSHQNLQSPPSYERAKLEIQTTYMRDQQKKYYPLLCDLKQFLKYGPGVYLPFSFLKYLLVVMGILVPLPTINIIMLVTSQDHFMGRNMQTTLQITTTSNIKESNETLVIALNFLVLFVLTISILYWRHMQTDEVLQCTKKTCLSSYYSVILTKIPNCYSQQHMVQFLQKKYGKVHQIYTVNDYQHDLLCYEQIQTILEEFKTQRQIFLRNREKKGCLKLIEHFLAYKQKHTEIIEHIVKDKSYEPMLAFVTFQSVEARNNLLQDLEVKFNRCGGKSRKEVQLGQQFLYKNQRLQFRSCQLEPNGIKWQNINVSVKEKLARYTLILCLLLTFLFISIMIFFILAATQSSLYSDEYDHYLQEQLLQMGKPQAIKSYCIDLSYSKFRSKSFCQPYFKEYAVYFSLYIIFPLLVTFLKGCFVVLMKKLVILRRHKYQFYRIKWEIVIVTLFYFIKSGLIKWLIYRNFAFGNTHIKMLDIFMPVLNQMAQILPIQPDHIPLYQNFNRQWVAHASHKTIMIALLSFNFSILFFHFTAVLGKKLRQRAAANQPTCHKMKQMLKGQQFDFEFLYAELLALFLFCMLYFSCSPLIYLFVFISLLLLYWVAKYSLLRLCKAPPIYSHSIHNMAIQIILVGLMINSLVSPLYYGNVEKSNPRSCFQCWKTYWYYTVNFVIILLFMSCRYQIVRLYYFAKNKIMSLIQDGFQQQRFARRINTMPPDLTGLKSYSMHSCEQYNQILKILVALNRNEVQKLGLFTQQFIKEIKQIVDHPNNEFKLFTQMQELLLAQIDSNSEDYQNNRQKYQSYNEQICRIKRQVQEEIEEEQRLVQLHCIVNNKLVELNKQALALVKLQSPLQKLNGGESKNRNKPDQGEQCMDTEVRII